jgi:DNA-binding transcriptional MerR regulator
MQRQFPGSTLTYDSSLPGGAELLFSALFAGGDLMLAQVSHLAGLEPYVIQNWVARGYLPPPVNKRYSRRQLSRILIIRMLRSVLQIEDICRLLRYVNGHLDDTADDLVDDSALYMALVALTEEEPPPMAEVLREYQEPFPGAQRRVEQVLEIMVLAYRAAVLKEQAMAYLGTLDAK